MYNPFSIEGKNILITGAASGIGRQCSIDFSKAGANVILLDINEEQLDITKSMCSPAVKSYSHKCNIVDVAGTEDVVKVAVTESGPIDGMLYCAGVERTLPYNHLTDKDYQQIYSVNVIGATNLLKVLTKKNIRAENAKYVLIASITALVGRPGVAAYAASKGAIVSLVKTLALEMATKGLNINCISPGTILTPLMEKMMESLTEEQQAERKSGFPLGLGRPSDIANAAMFLLSDAARWITGQNIVVDGGYISR